jgi:glutathione S-transferase
MTMAPQHARLLPAGEEPARDLVLYAADTPNSWKCASLLEELGVAFDVRLVDIMQNQQKEAGYLAINPNGRTPTLVDRTVKPEVAFPTRAISLQRSERLR